MALSLSAAPGPKATANNFASVARAHYRLAIEGESSLAFGSFTLFPNRFFTVATLQFFTPEGTSDRFDFTTALAEVNAGRPFAPHDAAGKALGWVVRGQWLSGEAPTGGLGLQWNLSDTPWLADRFDAPWKSFVQTFAKVNGDNGIFDLFHWYQFPLLKKVVSLRGSNAWYHDPDDSDRLILVQDLIFHTGRNVEFYFEHHYQNINGFHRSEGSQFLIGVRFSKK